MRTVYVCYSTVTGACNLYNLQVAHKPPNVRGSHPFWVGLTEEFQRQENPRRKKLTIKKIKKNSKTCSKPFPALSFLLSHLVKNTGFDIVNDVRNILSQNIITNSSGYTVRLVEHRFKSLQRLNQILNPANIIYNNVNVNVLNDSQIYVIGFDKNKIDIFIRESVTYKCYSTETCRVFSN